MLKSTKIKSLRNQKENEKKQMKERKKEKKRITGFRFAFLVSFSICVFFISVSVFFVPFSALLFLKPVRVCVPCMFLYMWNIYFFAMKAQKAFSACVWCDLALALALRALGYFSLRFLFSCSCQSSSYGKHIRTLLEIAAPLWNERMSLVLAGNNILSVRQHTEAFITIFLYWVLNIPKICKTISATYEVQRNNPWTEFAHVHGPISNIVFSGFGAEHRMQCIWTVLTRIIYLWTFSAQSKWHVHLIIIIVIIG